jgi:integrase
VTALLVAAHELMPRGMRSLTYVTLFGLLASTGMRLSEALRLERKDLNLDQPSLTVRETKFKKSRLVPIHIRTAKAPAIYQKAALATPRHPGCAHRICGANSIWPAFTPEAPARAEHFAPRMPRSPLFSRSTCFRSASRRFEKLIA